MHPPAKRPLLRVVAVAAAFWGGLEVALRVASLVPGSNAIYVSDERLGFRVRPRISVGLNTVNSGGFNDEEPGARAAGGLRCAFIGDSFVFGAVARKDNLVERFKALAGGPSRLEALNLGIPAAGPENYLRVLKHEVPARGVGIAIIVFFVGNDVSQSHPDFKTRIWLGEPRALLRSPWLLRASPDYWYSLKLLRSGWRLLRFMAWERSRSGEGTLPEDVFLEVEMQNLAICRREPGAFVQACYDGSIALLDAIRLESERQGVKLAVVLAPDQLQVDGALRSQLVSRFRLDVEAYDFERPQRMLRPALEARGLPVLDLLEDFRSQGERQPLYATRDTHWNERGNALAARRLFAFASERGLLATP